ncbi:MAG TPA: hypothetical protein VE951_03275 [Candidatus Angelobacter sp.]|jgi:hypothetical protein|nr:hypothetical protein [Candidatus Angelobacter sp.]
MMLELFDATHDAIEYQYPISLKTSPSGSVPSRSRAGPPKGGGTFNRTWTNIRVLTSPSG